MRVPSVSAWFPLLRATWAAYQRHNAQWLAAALAYFAALAVAPLIIVVVAVAGAFLHGHQSAINDIYTRLPGPETVAVRQVVASTLGQPRHGLIAQVAGWAFFVMAALGLFGSLQFALNTTWDATPQKIGIWQTVRRRAASFVMVLAVAALLLLSVVTDAALTAILAYLPHAFGGQATLVRGADLALTFAIVWLLFAVLFEFLPDARIAWRDVWLGAGITALLFVAGQFLLGLYLGRAGIGSAYGAFGSLVAFLIWANYSAQIVLFGAEFTRVYAEQRATLQAM
jgi:membrane protein